MSRSFRARFEGKSYYLKFDLVKSALANIPELGRLVKESGAIRSCAVVRTHGAWEPMAELPATYVDDPSWKVIKIPSLEGNELWLVPESKQSEMELKLGFDRPSEALHAIPAKTILSSAFRDPLFRAETRFKRKPDVICTSVTGVTLLSPTERWSLEQLENLKDLGNFAFED